MASSGDSKPQPSTPCGRMQASAASTSSPGTLERVPSKWMNGPAGVMSAGQLSVQASGMTTGLTGSSPVKRLMRALQPV